MRLKNNYIPCNVVYQMLLRLIYKYNFSTKELAEKLGLTQAEVESILTRKAVRKKLAAKLTIPLTELYCKIHN